MGSGSAGIHQSAPRQLPQGVLSHCILASSGQVLLSAFAPTQEEDDASQRLIEYEPGHSVSAFLTKDEVIRVKVSRLAERLRKRYPTSNLGAGLGGRMVEPA